MFYVTKKISFYLFYFKIGTSSVQIYKKGRLGEYKSQPEFAVFVSKIDGDRTWRGFCDDVLGLLLLT